MSPKSPTVVPKTISFFAPLSAAGDAADAADVLSF
jgi:hypothetical protein